MGVGELGHVVVVGSQLTERRVHGLFWMGGGWGSGSGRGRCAGRYIQHFLDLISRMLTVFHSHLV